MKYHKPIPLIAMVALGCTSVKGSLKEEEFKRYWNPAMENSIRNSADDPERIKIFGQNLTFQGNIVEGDCDRVKAKLAEAQVSYLRVNSQGGSVKEAICIAEYLEKKRVKGTIVDGVCWSSCANYLFLGAKNKIIERGTVGFHGNMTALLKEKGVIGILKKGIKNKIAIADANKFREYLGAKPSSTSLSSAERKALVAALEVYESEQRFFLARGLQAQEFFDLTQRQDKGEGDGKTYIFMMPSPHYLRKYGVQIQGEQDQLFISKFNEKSPSKLLLKN